MKSDANEKAQKQADKCENNFICQAAGGKPQCAISETVNGSVFFLECRQALSCSYQHAFGSSFMCTCPVRQEIYKKHRI